MAMTAWAEQKHINIEARKEIGKLKKRITELEANQAKLDLNKIKADAIREAVKLYKNKVFDGCDIYSDGLLDYADKLEQGK
jgi:cell division protein FtsB